MGVYMFLFSIMPLPEGAFRTRQKNTTVLHINVCFKLY